MDGRMPALAKGWAAAGGPVRLHTYRCFCPGDQRFPRSTEERTSAERALLGRQNREWRGWRKVDTRNLGCPPCRPAEPEQGQSEAAWLPVAPAHRMRLVRAQRHVSGRGLGGRVRPGRGSCCPGGQGRRDAGRPRRPYKLSPCKAPRDRPHLGTVHPFRGADAADRLALLLTHGLLGAQLPRCQGTKGKTQLGGHHHLISGKEAR